MEKVAGVGGIFFRAKDPITLAQWYEEHLGIPRVPKTYEEGSWWQDEGPTVFDPFDDENEFFQPYDASWILNFRVRDLDSMAKQLRAAGVSVEVDPEQYPNGRFAYLRDPEGNPLQLWEPGGTDAVRPSSL